MKIDAHQHFWHPARGDYGWMPPDDPVLARPYRPADLAPHLAQHGIEATILVQAAPSIAETEYLLGIADATDFVFGVVGWVDFERPQDRAELHRLARHPKLLGLRPMIQDLPDPDWMLRPEVQWGFETLCDLGLCFDALGFPRHLANFERLMARHPDLTLVIDHCMKPAIAAAEPGAFAAWAEGMAALAARGAYCKISGLITEAGADWKIGDLDPYVEHVLTVFGPGRLMWGSDWPVCRLRGEYGAWLHAAQSLCCALSDRDRALIFGETAATFYARS